MDWRLGEVFESAHGAVRWASWGTGDPIVLLHGTPFSSYVWRDIAAALSRRHRVFVWDMLGYGQSEKGEGQDVSLAAQGRVFAELLDHWGLASPGVVAHDFGGCVALRAHLLHEARYSRLALVDVVALGPWGTGFYRLAQTNAEVFSSLPAAHHEALVRRHIRSAAHRQLRDEAVDALTAPWLGTKGQRAYYRKIQQNTQAFTDEIEGRYGELDLPVLVGWGTEDTWIPIDKGRELAARIPGARFEPVSGAGHLIQEDAPAQLTGLLAEFLHD